MKWTIESVTHNDDPTITVRIAVTLDDGSLRYDQNSLPDTASDDDIRKLCDELCAKHAVAPKKDFSHLVGTGSS
jgi:hypothetical protein